PSLMAGSSPLLSFSSLWTCGSLYAGPPGAVPAPAAHAIGGVGGRGFAARLEGRPERKVRKGRRIDGLPAWGPSRGTEPPGPAPPAPAVLNRPQLAPQQNSHEAVSGATAP